MKLVYSIISCTATWPSGKAEACKAFTPGSNPGVAFFYWNTVKNLQILSQN